MARCFLAVILLLCACSIERKGASSSRFSPVSADAGSTDASGTVAPRDAGAGGIASDAGSDAHVGAPTDAGEDAGSSPDAATSTDAGPSGFTPPAGDVGAPCASAMECNGLGAQCLTKLGSGSSAVTVPNGYCTRGCTQALELQLCGSGTRCLSIGNNANLCVRTCMGDDDCRSGEGYICRSGLCSLPNL